MTDCVGRLPRTRAEPSPDFRLLDKTYCFQLPCLQNYCKKQLLCLQNYCFPSVLLAFKSSLCFMLLPWSLKCNLLQCRWDILPFWQSYSLSFKSQLGLHLFSRERVQTYCSDTNCHLFQRTFRHRHNGTPALSSSLDGMVLPSNPFGINTKASMGVSLFQNKHFLQHQGPLRQ